MPQGGRGAHQARRGARGHEWLRLAARARIDAAAAAHRRRPLPSHTHTRTHARTRTRRLATLGRTNGIEVSADGGTLFVSEAFNSGGAPVSNVVWRYPVRGDGTLDARGRALVIDFDAADGSARRDVDGMRLSADGRRLYVTRNGGGGAVAVVDPMGTNKILETIKLPFANPTNLEFGGPDGRTLFVVGRCGDTPHGVGDGCVEALRVAAPGLAWSNLQKGLPKVAL